MMRSSSTIKESDEMGCSVPPGDGTTREGDGFVALPPLPLLLPLLQLPTTVIDTLC